MKAFPIRHPRTHSVVVGSLTPITSLKVQALVTLLKIALCGSLLMKWLDCGMWEWLNNVENTKFLATRNWCFHPDGSREVFIYGHLLLTHMGPTMVSSKLFINTSQELVDAKIHKWIGQCLRKKEFSSIFNLSFLLFNTGCVGICGRGPPTYIRYFWILLQ